MGGERMKKKIIATALPLLFITLIVLPACNAGLYIPVEVERLKDVGMVRMRGDPHTQSFLFHYVNLAPYTQEVRLEGDFNPSMIGLPSLPIYFVVQPGDSLDHSMYVGGSASFTLDFDVGVKRYMITEPYTTVISETVSIPP